MVTCRHLLIVLLSLCCLPAWAARQPQRCLSCHPSHHAARGVCTDCHHGNPDSERKNIAHQRLIPGTYIRFTLGDLTEVRAGRQLMELCACRRCHVSGGTGNRLATNLDDVPDRKTPGELVASIRHPALAMPDFGLDEERAVTIVSALLANARNRKGATKDAPLVVHFDRTATGRKDIFTRKCGACHQALTARMGIVGSGGIGPNLSGLLTPWYPKTYGNSKAWTVPRLARWLKNPRAVRPWARMQPVALTDSEFAKLEQIIRTKGAP